MNYYAIGIGGTGAKIIESLVHLCAAGLMPSGNLYVLFVDPDRANGSLERARTTIQSYINCHKIQRGNIELFKTEISRSEPDFWSPFGEHNNPDLESFFQYHNLTQSNKSAADLFDVLYSEQEKTTNLNMGFRGHPSIGSAVMAKTVDLGNAEPWLTFKQMVENDAGAGTGARIFLCGSIFGGTGASGFPTIARLIRNELTKIGGTNVKIGGALILPYFSFTPGTSQELRASSENFMMNTQVALKYYYQQKAINIFDAVYLIGDESRAPVEFHLGGREQNNDPHFVELYSALSSIHFFEKDTFSENHYSMIARNNKSSMHWADLPFGENVREKIEQIARFAFAYLHVYFPKIENINGKGKEWTAPWYIDLFKRSKVSLEDNMQILGNVKDYCVKFLTWLACIQYSAVSNIAGDIPNAKIELINHLAFADVDQNSKRITLKDPSYFRNEEFYSLALPAGQEDRNALDKLWKYMCGAKVKDKNADGVGKFINALYTQCSKIR